MERALGGTAVFANGALGGMVVPDIEEDLDERERAAAVARIGRAAAERALRLLSSAPDAEVGAIGCVRKEVELAASNELFLTIERLGLVEPRRRGDRGMWTEVGRLDLGPASFALLPGEPTPRVGAAAEAVIAGQGARKTGVIGLANDELGYLLDREQFEDPEFSYEVTMSVGPDAAAEVLAALAALPPRR
jgi:hypothetical protein